MTTTTRTTKTTTTKRTTTMTTTTRTTKTTTTKRTTTKRTTTKRTTTMTITTRTTKTTTRTRTTKRTTTTSKTTKRTTTKTETTTKINSDPCNNYKILNDKNRNIENGNFPVKCDKSDSDHASPDWQGLDWYRILPPAGTQITTQAPGMYKCGTQITGWINGLPALTIGQTETATVCYQSGNNVCAFKGEINITLCADNNKYLVYQLPDTPTCSLKYCTDPVRRPSVSKGGR